MVTETMLLIAIRQKNWDHSSKIAKELAESAGNSFYSTIAVLSKKAASDKKSEFLLKLWAEIKWKKH